MSKLHFYSLTSSDIPQAQIDHELIPKVSKCLLELYNIKKSILEQNNKPNQEQEQKEEIMNNFKLLMDLIEIYENKEVIGLIKDILEEKQKAKDEEAEKKENDKRKQDMLEQRLYAERERENEKRRRRLLHRQFGREYENDNDKHTVFSENEHFWNSRSPPDYSNSLAHLTMMNLNNKLFDRNEPEPSSPDVNSDMEHDVFDADKVKKLFDDAYSGIGENSMLRTNYSVERKYLCDLEHVEESDNKDKQTQTQTQNQTKTQVLVNAEQCVGPEDIRNCEIDKQSQNNSNSEVALMRNSNTDYNNMDWLELMTTNPAITNNLFKID